jgi:hypothetical protein
MTTRVEARIPRLYRTFRCRRRITSRLVHDLPWGEPTLSAETSVVSLMSVYKSGHGFGDLVGRTGPDEGLRILVVVIDERWRMAFSSCSVLR